MCFFRSLLRARVSPGVSDRVPPRIRVFRQSVLDQGVPVQASLSGVSKAFVCVPRVSQTLYGHSGRTPATPLDTRECEVQRAAGTPPDTPLNARVFRDTPSGTPGGTQARSARETPVASRGGNLSQDFCSWNGTPIMGSNGTFVAAFSSLVHQSCANKEIGKGGKRNPNKGGCR